ncbi:hypothetical protein [Desulfosarcina cetonica]|uniref:hypothetical protein n=1 Tax=Desulfosarcina cetonica TaxID=90730 RepID=UPI00155DDDEF|nr:hypothetical protein [Desulfosarcina cetonica]
MNQEKNGRPFKATRPLIDGSWGRIVFEKYSDGIEHGGKRDADTPTIKCESGFFEDKDELRDHHDQRCHCN